MGKKLINPLLEVVNNKIMLINPYMIGNGIPRDGLIGEWLFSGNANDTSGYGHNGTVNGATLTIDRKGNYNSAYSFDGLDDYIEIGDYCDMGLLDMTISFWAKLQTTGTYQGLVSKSSAVTGSSYRFGCVISNTNDKYLNFIIGARGGIQINSFSNSAFSGVWDHIICEYDRNSMIRIYINNVLQISSTLIDDIASNDMQSSFPLRFGAYNSNGTPTFFAKGSLDDIRIYNRLLTIDEKSALYNE